MRGQGGPGGRVLGRDGVGEFWVVQGLGGQAGGRREFSHALAGGEGEHGHACGDCRQGAVDASGDHCRRALKRREPLGCAVEEHDGRPVLAGDVDVSFRLGEHARSGVREEAAEEGREVRVRRLQSLEVRGQADGEEGSGAECRRCVAGRDGSSGRRRREEVAGAAGRCDHISTPLVCCDKPIRRTGKRRRASSLPYTFFTNEQSTIRGRRGNSR